MTAAHYILVLASSLTALQASVGNVTQIRRVLTRMSSADLSRSNLLLGSAGQMAWTAYGLLLPVPNMFISGPNLMGGTLSLVLLALTFRYGRGGGVDAEPAAVAAAAGS